METILLKHVIHVTIRDISTKYRKIFLNLGDIKFPEKFIEVDDKVQYSMFSKIKRSPIEYLKNTRIILALSIQ